MTDLGRREEFLPPGNIENIEVSRMAIFVAAVRILVEQAKPLLRMKQLTEIATQLRETARRKLFTDRSRLTADYDGPRSEIAAFLISCRRMFSCLATFSGL